MEDKLAEYKAVSAQCDADKIIRHLRLAEAHFDNATQTGESELFLDVIYRSNQAFEGALKELYSVITQKDASRKTPKQIEDFIVDEGHLTSRVVDPIKAYRSDWRNPSAHDHRLDFTEYEAITALTTVSTLCYIVMDYATKKSAEAQVVFKTDPLVREDFEIGERWRRFTEVVEERFPSLDEFRDEAGRLAASTITGFIEAVLRSVFEPWRIRSDFQFVMENGQTLRPDFLLSEEDELRAMVELVMPSDMSFGSAMAHRKMEALWGWLPEERSVSGAVIVIPRARYKGKTFFALKSYERLDGMVAILPSVS